MALQVIKERFGVAANQLRLYVHYQPSYYHFHVHVTHVDWEGPGALVGKAHLLSEIIGIKLHASWPSWPKCCCTFCNYGLIPVLQQLY